MMCVQGSFKCHSWFEVWSATVILVETRAYTPIGVGLIDLAPC